MFGLRYFRLRNKVVINDQIRKISMSNNGFHDALFNKNLLLTNILTSGACMFIGDLAQQIIEHRSQILPDALDWRRLGRMSLVGIIIGPLQHYYYIYLDKLLPHVTIKTTLTKILCDQLIVSPLTLIIFFSTMNMLENRTLKEIKYEIVQKFPCSYLADCLFWPPLQFINFYLLPTCYRVTFINAATAVFNIFLSFIKHCDEK